ncbi:MAG TPA: exodeoxyribonuclease VII large subunit [Methylomirabilota bacterium]|jgi:exodeoxyribonuclease VII large subunit|nr:exodeoxyribonuclease VII large subunit [Methylomirabilota bacterium]
MSERVVCTVSELVLRIKETLEDRFPAVWVEGEISNLRIPSSGHVYFTLKDDGAQLRCVLFRSRGRRVAFQPEDGMQVLAFGGLDVYAARGEYQLIVELLEPKGVGALQLAFEQLKRRLEAEGLFEAGRKRALPPFPRTIGIVTSPTGAAIRDMLHVIGRRFADLRVLITPVRVQGEEAPGEIVRALRDLQEVPELDVVIVGRGGGSIEDLWAFNDERVARAISACRVPVISAVGHETDFTIADFVADLRAPTPSAAAEVVVREKLHVIRALCDMYDTLKQAMAARLARERQRIDSLGRRRVLTDAARALRDWHRRLDELSTRLALGARANRRLGEHRLSLARNALRSLNPVARIANGTVVLAQLRVRLASAGANRAKTARHRLDAAVGQLDSLSPLAVLGRGYSLTRLLPSGAIVRSAAQTRPGDAIEILLREGALDARVERLKERDDRPQV